jgi:hypothetical protein
MNNYIKNTTVSIHYSLNSMKASVWSSVKASVWECVLDKRESVQDRVRHSAWNSVGSPVKSSVRELIQEMN